MIGTRRVRGGSRPSLRALLVAWFCATSLPSLACQILPPAEEAARNAANLARERALARDIARRADVIFIGVVTSTTDSPSLDSPAATTRVREGNLQVTEILKGQPADRVTVPMSHTILMSCDGADMFSEVYLRTNETYLVYLAQGDPLRAGWVGTSTPAGSLTLEQERAIIRDVLGARTKPVTP